MNFPALIIFSDYSMKVVNSINEINTDHEWSGCNYDDGDIVIDCDLSFGTFARISNEDKLKSFLLCSNIHPHSCSETEMLDIAKILEDNIRNSEISDEEIQLARCITQKINISINL